MSIDYPDAQRIIESLIQDVVNRDLVRGTDSPHTIPLEPLSMKMLFESLDLIRPTLAAIEETDRKLRAAFKGQYYWQINETFKSLTGREPEYGKDLPSPEDYDSPIPYP
jgi:hypothetical protein